MIGTEKEKSDAKFVIGSDLNPIKRANFDAINNKKQTKSKSLKQNTKRKMMKQFAFASLAALTMAAPKVSVSYTKPAITIQPCNDAIFKFPMDRRAKDPANNCVGW